MKLIIGVDPGVHGALGCIHGDKATLLDIPTKPKGGSGKIKNEIDARDLARMLRVVCANSAKEADVVFVVERVSTMPGRPFRKEEGGEVIEGHDREGRQQSGAGAFSLGDSVGCIRGVIGALGYDIMWLTPLKWKYYWSLAKKKDQKTLARLKATELYPSLTDELCLKKHGDRADALLMARYAWEQEIHR